MNKAEVSPTKTRVKGNYSPHNYGHNCVNKFNNDVLPRPEMASARNCLSDGKLKRGVGGSVAIESWLVRASKSTACMEEIMRSLLKTGFLFRWLSAEAAMDFRSLRIERK